VRPRIDENPPDHDAPERRAVVAQFRALVVQHPGISPWILTITARLWQANRTLRRQLEQRGPRRSGMHGAPTYAEHEHDRRGDPWRYDYEALTALPTPARVQRAVYWLAALADLGSATPFLPPARPMDDQLDPNARLNQLLRIGPVYSLLRREREAEAARISSDQAAELLRLVQEQADFHWLNHLDATRQRIAADPSACQEAARWVDRAWADKRPKRRLVMLCRYLTSPQDPEHAAALARAGAPGEELRQQLAMLAVALVTDPAAAVHLGPVTNLAQVPFGLNPERDPHVSDRHLLAGRQFVCDEIWDGAEPWRTYLDGTRDGPGSSKKPPTEQEQPRMEEEEQPPDLRGYRSAKWFNNATKLDHQNGMGALYPNLLRAAGRDGRLTNRVKQNGQWHYNVDEVCKRFSDHRDRIQQALQEQSSE